MRLIAIVILMCRLTLRTFPYTMCNWAYFSIVLCALPRSDWLVNSSWEAELWILLRWALTAAIFFTLDFYKNQLKEEAKINMKKRMIAQAKGLYL